MKKVAVGILILILLMPTSIKGAITYEKVEIETITRGVEYKKKVKLLENGLREIHILKIPLKNEYISIKEVSGVDDLFGVKDTVKNLLSQEGAIGGTNGDFFEISSKLESSKSIVVRDSNLISLDSDLNATKNLYGGFFLTKELYPYLAYSKSEIILYSNSVPIIRLSSQNKINKLQYPTYLDYNVIKSTKELHEVRDLYKVVVDKNNTIKKVAKPKEVVNLEESEFVIILTEYNYKKNRKFFYIGGNLNIQIESNIVIDNLVTAFGGGGIILSNGKEVLNSGLFPLGSQPRTSLGITKDRENIILVVVDGRTHNIGVTKKELIDILKDEGIVDAINLDGGGSSTMVKKNNYSNKLEVANVISDKYERKVVNAIGVFENYPKGELRDIVSTSSKDIYFEGETPKINTYGVDQYNNRIDVSKNINIVNTAVENLYQVVYSNDEIVKFNDILLNYKKIVEINPNNELLELNIAEKKELTFIGLTEDGYARKIDNSIVGYTIVPKEIGEIVDGVLEAKRSGVGYIKGEVNGIVGYQKISVYAEETIENFDLIKSVETKVYPKTALGDGVLITDGTYNRILQVNYQFKGSKYNNEAIYIKMNKKNLLNDGIYGIALDIKGDSSGNWVRGKIKDRKGKIHTIDFTKNINFDSNERLIAKIPIYIEKPIVLEEIYIVSVKNVAPINSSVLIDNITALYKNSADDIVVPEIIKYVDNKKVDVAVNLEGVTEITIIANSNDVTTENIDIIKNSDLVISKDDITTVIENDIEKLRWTSSFDIIEKNNELILFLPDANKDVPLNVLLEIIGASDKSNIIILMDTSLPNIKPVERFNFINDELSELDKKGKQILVVSNDEKPYLNRKIDGVHYINLEKNKEDTEKVVEKTKKENILKIRLLGNVMQYNTY